MQVILLVFCLCNLAARQGAWWVVGFIIPSTPRGDKVLVFREVDVATVGTDV